MDGKKKKQKSKVRRALKSRINDELDKLDNLLNIKKPALAS